VVERLTGSFPFLLLAGLAALTFWLNSVVQPPGPVTQPASRHDPDFIVDNLSAVNTSPAGVAVYTLSAARMEHYPDDDSTHLTRPRLVSYRSKEAPVTITAEEAFVSSNGANVYLHNDVKVTRAAYADRSELVMRTTYLHVIPDDNIAKTDRHVTITDAATVVNAVGLELNGNTRVLKLFSKVKGTYDPQKAPARDARK
jgi:lipopolysaccharide export system protein LptC